MKVDAILKMHVTGVNPQMTNIKNTDESANVIPFELKII